jgi:hypothetical protein
MYFRNLENQIVTVVTAAGEVIGRLSSADSHSYIEVESPRMFVPSEQGYGFAPGICMTGEPNPKSAVITINNVITVQKCHPELAASWIQQTTGLVV